MRRVDPDGVSAMVVDMHALSVFIALEAFIEAPVILLTLCSQDIQNYKSRFRHMVENLFKDFV